jgi:hypothetical protein
VASPLENHKAALERVSKWVESKFKEAGQLSTQELAATPVANATLGWRLPFEGSGSLQLVLDKDFPYSEPRIIVEGRPLLLGGPHLESKGKICIAGDGGRFDTLNPVTVVEYVYHAAVSLLKGNEAKENDADFQHDFGAYWRREEQDAVPLRTLIAPNGPSRKIVGWSGKITYVADDAALLTRFLKNMKVSASAVLKPAFAIWMKRLPRPDEYPASVEELRRLVASNSDDGLRVLDDVLTNPNLPVAGVLMGPAGGSRPAGLGGIRIEDKSVPFWLGSKVQDPLNRGFRPGKVPPVILAQRLQLKRVHVVEIDSAKSRRPSYLSSELFSKKVMLIGCGSLGSGIAKLLLQSGVGEVILIDPDAIGWVNIERHELGATSVALNKAKALASDFQAKFPLAEVSVYPTTWLEAYRQNQQMFEESSLIVTTCANWNAESALSDLQQSGAFPVPVLFGWLEESALAAHAVALDFNSPCFRCGFSATGEPLFPVVRASNGIPAGCGGGISLYGAIDMAPAQAMIAGAALDVLLGKAKAPVHRVWVCTKANLDTAGADWSPSWISEHGLPPVGGTILPSAWPGKEGCSCRS